MRIFYTFNLMKRLLLTYIFFSLVQFFASCQEISNNIIIKTDVDKCGIPPDSTFLKKCTRNWGYGYDDLFADISSWTSNPNVWLDSIGITNLEHTLFLLTITDSSSNSSDKSCVSIHARTHPAEVQSTYVTNEIIRFLLSKNETAKLLLEQCVFYIIPMINPDGVELKFPRENANNIDLESNWSSENLEIETAALQSFFENVMYSENPLRLSLNMHSAYACKRYFVYHDPTGTSPVFARDERDFISSITRYWPSGFEEWDYFISWTNGTPAYYPESWFWMNFREQIMALTYEDMNCDAAGDYDKTASSILNGIADFLDLRPANSEFVLQDEPEIRIFPNPVMANNTVTIYSSQPITKLRLTELGTGKNMKIQVLNKNEIRILSNCNGLYILSIVFNNKTVYKKLIVN